MTDLSSLVIPASLAALVVTGWFLWRSRRMKVFKDLGIPGPTPNLWTGNLNEIIAKGSKCETEWVEKYGRILGFFLGAKPILMVADPELLRIILVKEFNNFINKDVFLPYAGVSASELKHSIGLQKDEKWKFIRSIITPAFSVGKLRLMTPILNDSIDVFLEKVSQKESSKESFDIYPLYRKLVLDIVSRSSFGVSTNVQHEESNFYLKCVMRVLNNGTSDMFNFISLCVPELEPIPTWLKISIDKMRGMIGLPSVKRLIDICEEVIESRKSSPENHRPDLLQNLIDSNISNDDLNSKKMEDLTANDSAKEHTSTSGLTGPGKNQRFMTNDEIKANAMVFIIAGYDSTSASLAFTTHFLINNPQIQDKVRKEIREKIQSKEELTYEILSSLSYLDQVYSETLRLYPPLTSFITRVSSRDFYYKGIKIPKGMTVQAPLWHIHRDAEYWSDPHVFCPDRFSIENKSRINTWMYQPFGSGPRNCVGLRMAKNVVKLTLARLLYNFELVSCEGTEKELQIDPKMFVNYPKNGVKLLALSTGCK